MKRIYNVSSGSKDPVEKTLSNLSDRYPFRVNDTPFSSVEIPLQMIKFPEESEERKEILELSGKDAGRRAKELGSKAIGDYVYWDGKVIRYNSQEHRALLEMLIKEKFSQNEGAMEALLSTANGKLDHNVGPESPNTSLPKDVFLGILIKIRNEELALRKK